MVTTINHRERTCRRRPFSEVFPKIALKEEKRKTTIMFSLM